VSGNLFKLFEVIAIAHIIMCYIYCVVYRYSFLYTPWSWDEILLITISILGSLLRWWSFITLGKFFTYNVGIRKEHKLITHGPYRLLIHPSYTVGFFASYAGLVYTMAYPWVRGWLFVLSFSLWAVALIMRVANEEESLKDHFGAAEWKKYVSTRWKFIPLVY